jgi:Protein of unknown function (DUF1670)
MMNQSSPFSSMLRKTFDSALEYLLYTEYRFLGGKRIVKMIVNDVKGLIEQFFPDNLEVGQVIWPAVSVNESQEQHKKIEDHKIIPVRLNLVTREDMEKLEKKVKRTEIEKARAIRLFNEAYEQGALLTLADVGVLLGKSISIVSRYVQEYQKEHDKILPTRGNIHDIGPGITHKGIIVRKKLEKKSSTQIAKETNHSPEAVDRYIRDYGRVKMLIGKRMTVEEISYATGISRGVVEQYKDLYELENSDNSEKKE